MAGFEPAASCSQSRRAAKLRHIPLAAVAYLPPKASSCPNVPVDDDGGRMAFRREHGAVAMPCPVWRVETVRYPRSDLVTPLRRGCRAGVAQWQSPSLPSWS
jgi:hypothetical protein